MRSKTVDRLLKNTPKDVEIFVDLYADLVVHINDVLREKNLNKKDLSKKMGKSPSEISKWLGGGHNFTLRSLAKLSAELGEPLLKVPLRKPHTNFVGSYSTSVHTFVAHTRTQPTRPAKVIQWDEVVNPNPLGNVG